MGIIGIAAWYEAEDAVNGDAGKTVVAESVDGDENGAADVDDDAKVADVLLVGNVELLTTESRNDNLLLLLLLLLSSQSSVLDHDLTCSLRQ